MIAEINNKLTTGEDELTGNFFGSMRYLGFNDFLIPILKETSHSENDIVKEMLMNKKFKEETFEFWKRHKQGEIDCYFENDEMGIGIEVKLDSGLSSEDQLMREAEMLNFWAKNKQKVLFFIARNRENCIGPYNENYENCMKKGVILSWISWQDIYEEIEKVYNIRKENKANNIKQILLIEDLKKFLYKKEFERFTGFEIDDDKKQIDKKNFFKFKYKVNNRFNFIFNDVIKENKYEF